MPSLPPSDLIHDLARIELLVAEHDPALLPAWAVATKVTRKVATKTQKVLVSTKKKQLRNDYLCKAVELIDEPTPSERAEELGELIEQYRAGQWTKHVTSATCPPSIAGTVKEYIWRALKLDSDCPTSRRWMIKITTGKLPVHH